MKIIIFVLFLAFVFVNAFDFAEYDTPESVPSDAKVDTPQPLALSTTNSTTTQAVVDLVTTTTTTTQPSTTADPPVTNTSQTTSAPKMATAAPTATPVTTTTTGAPTTASSTGTRSTAYQIDKTLKERLINFEHRIAKLVLI